MSRGSQELTFRLITGQSELFATVDDWRQLSAASADPQPMLDASWLLGWWRQYGAGVKLAVGLLFDDDRLVGLAPLCIRRYHYVPGLVFRRLQFMAVDADEWDSLCSMYMGFVAMKGYEATVTREFVDRIAAGAFGAWDEVVLGPMNTDSAMSALMRRQLGQYGFRCEEKRRTINYYTRLAPTWEMYLQSLPAGRRKYIQGTLDAFEKSAARCGGWVLERAVTSAARDRAFTTLINLQHDRSSPRFIAFQRDYINNRSVADQVEIMLLKVGGTPVAAVYTIRNGRKVLAYHYGGSASGPITDVGVVINALLINQAITRGDQAFDFLSGGFGFEANFATDERPIASLRAARPTWRELVRHSLLNARDGARSAAGAARSRWRRQPVATMTKPAQR